MSPRPQIPTQAMLEKNLLATQGRWMWLYEVEVPTDPPTRYRFVRDPTEITFRGNVYSPFPITHSEVTENDQGDLPSLKMTASNASREIISVLNAHNGLVGQSCRIVLTHSLIIATSKSVWEEDFTILDTSANDKAVTCTLGDMNLYEAKLPGERMMRFYCRYEYKGGMCGYNVDPSHAAYLPTCDKSLNGLNGCKKHGDSEASAGVVAIHPERFGGFPGIPEPTTFGGLR